MRKRTLLLTTIAVLALGLTACAGGADDDASPAAEPAADETTQEMSPADETATQAASAADDDALLAQLEDIQGQLDPWFEGCDWESSVSDGIGQGTCAEHEIGVISGPGESSVQGILDAMGENGTGGYVAEGGWAVWSTDMGNVRQAWDVLGTPGEPTEF